MKNSLALIAFIAMPLVTLRAYQLHEWGTFTTVAGSDGVLLSGLQREEEELPRFVHAHFGFENGQTINGDYLRLMKSHGFSGFTPLVKGLGVRPVSGVTVKMETPVIYFHSEKAFRAQVKVGFHGGTISQWYPERSGGENLPEPPPPADPVKHPVPHRQWEINFANPYNGAIEWDVAVLSPEESRSAVTFKPRDTLNWLRARVPEANAVRTESGETESYLFYRGIGNFKPGLLTTVSTDETLHLHNQSGGDIPYFLVFERNEGKIRWSESRGGLKSDATFELQESALTSSEKPFPTDIYQSMVAGLAATGLLESEARAMVETWWSSYFENDGLRVFWVLPGTSTERILPLSVTPPPEKTVRVLVGRSEVLRPRAEAEWLAQSRLKGDAAAPWQYFVLGNRFGLAVEERIKALGNATAAK